MTVSVPATYEAQLRSIQAMPAGRARTHRHKAWRDDLARRGLAARWELDARDRYRLVALVPHARPFLQLTKKDARMHCAAARRGGIVVPCRTAGARPSPQGAPQ